MEIISSFKGRFKEKNLSLKIISEKDRGIYDAMNKGIKMASGKWINFLNAGDSFYDNHVLFHVRSRLESTHADILYGSFRKYNSYYEAVITPPDIHNLLRQMILCHQAVFVRTEVHKNYLFDLQYDLVSDYNTILKMYLDNQNFEFINYILVDYSLDGISYRRAADTYRQIRKVRQDNGIMTESLLEHLLYLYGITKRKCLSLLPQKLRWKIVKIKKKFISGDALY